MGAHTPGEWVADFHHEMQVGTRFTVMVRGGNRLEPIAAVPAGVVGHGREEGRANARLIAAAPELLAAVEREYETLADVRNDWPGRYTPEGQAKLCRLRNLIAKATGRTEQDVQDDYGNRAVAREYTQVSP